VPMGAVALNTREKADSFLSWKWNPSVRATGADCYRVVRLEHHYLAVSSGVGARIGRGIVATS
jgi:hypothetical protein